MRLRMGAVVGGATEGHETHVRQGHGDEGRPQRQSRPHLQRRENALREGQQNVGFADMVMRE